MIAAQNNINIAQKYMSDQLRRDSLRGGNDQHSLRDVGSQRRTSSSSTTSSIRNEDTSSWQEGYNANTYTQPPAMIEHEEDRPETFSFIYLKQSSSLLAVNVIIGKDPNSSS